MVSKDFHQPAAQGVKHFFLERIVYASLRAWMLRLAFTSLLLSWTLLLHVVQSKRISLIDVTAALDVKAALNLVKVGHADDTIRFGVWGVCNGEAEIATFFHTFHIPAQCDPHPVGKVDFGSKISGILSLGDSDAVRLVNEAEALLDAFVKLHPFSVAMGVIGWAVSMSRPRVLKWRTKTIVRLPDPEWAVIPAAIGALCTIVLSACFGLIQLADHLKVKVLSLDFKLFDITASVSVHEGNAKTWDNLATFFFCVATAIYLLCFLGRARWRRTKWSRKLAPSLKPVPIVQLDEFLRLKRRDPESHQLAELSTSTSTPARLPDPESQAPGPELREASTIPPVHHEYEKHVEPPNVEPPHVKK